MEMKGKGREKMAGVWPMRRVRRENGGLRGSSKIGRVTVLGKWGKRKWGRGPAKGNFGEEREKWEGKKKRK